jgi:hypothetical protein
MANVIALSESYVPVLDEVYKLSSLTAVLDSNQELVTFSAGSKTFKVPQIEMQGLATQSRVGNFVEGDVTLTWVSKTPDYDRSRMFNVDAMDQAESQNIAFGQLAGEFIRTKVVPEVDAFRFAKYYTLGTKVGTLASLTTGAGVIAAISAGSEAMDNAEVPYEGRWLFITPALHNLIINLNTDESREILGQFQGRIVKVPQSRFYSAVTLKTGGSGQEAGGFEFAPTASDINFMIIHPSAVIQTLKHVAPKIVSPEANQMGDAWKFGYRVYGIADLLGNKLAGVYSHAKVARTV